MLQLCTYVHVCLTPPMRILKKANRDKKHCQLYYMYDRCEILGPDLFRKLEQSPIFSTVMFYLTGEKKEEAL